MVDFKKRTGSSVAAASYDESPRQRAREVFAASVRAIIGRRQPLAALSEFDDIEMMEAATALTRKK